MFRTLILFLLASCAAAASSTGGVTDQTAQFEMNGPRKLKKHLFPKRHHGKNKSNACKAHTSCGECSSSSWGCHWCGHDNACHPIGSGCVKGMECHDNNKTCHGSDCDNAEKKTCQRTKAERVKPVPLGEGIGIGFFVAVSGLTLVAFLCFTFVYCTVGSMKNEYDDLVVASNPDQQCTTFFFMPKSEGQDLLQVTESTIDYEDPEDATLPLDSLSASERPEPQTALTPLIPVTNNSRIESTEQAYTRMDRLYTRCSLCYIFTILSLGLVSFGAFFYFPRIPVYDMCNDTVAWKSIIDSMKSLEVDAKFDILVSVLNSNRLDVQLNTGRGDFRFDGSYIGTFELPPNAVLKANSITDISITAHLTPEKRQVLKLTEDYYQNKLVFMIDLQAEASLPFLPGGHSFAVSMDDRRLDVLHTPNPSDQESLCACGGDSSSRMGIVARMD